MENILKRLNSKWFLLFLIMFFSLGMQAQYNEDKDGDGHPDWVEEAWDETEAGTNSHWESNDNGGFEEEEFDYDKLELYVVEMDNEAYDDWLASGGWEDTKDHSSEDMTHDANRTGAHYVENYQYNDDDGWGAFMDEYESWIAQMEQEEQEAVDDYLNSIVDDELPTEDNNATTETPTPEPPVEGKWYLDNDGDGYDSGTSNSETRPGSNWKEGTSKGSDCNDDPQTGELVYKLNKCGKCEVEPESTDWKISDVINNATGLLKEMIVRAKLTAPNLKIIKSGNHQGAKSKVKCAEINIGENAAEIKSNSLLAFELSHIINTNLHNTTFKDGLLKTKADFIKGAALFEAEGFVFSQIIKNTEAKTLNDCEKSLLGISTLKQDYSNLTLDQIKNQIRQNGELVFKAEDLIKNGIVVSTGKTLVQKYESEYNRWQSLINYYRTVKKFSETKIATILRNEKPDCN